MICASILLAAAWIPSANLFPCVGPQDVLGNASVQEPAADVPAVSVSLPELIAQYQADQGTLRRVWSFPFSQAGHSRMAALHADWLARIEQVDFDHLPRNAKIDWLLLRNEIEHNLRTCMTERGLTAENQQLAPFVTPLVELLERHARRQPVQAEKAAEALHAAVEAIAATRKQFTENKPAVTSTAANRASRQVGRLRSELSGWMRYADGYDPVFSWWNRAPWETLEKELRSFEKFLRKDIGGLNDNDPDQLIGDPIGRDALLAELEYERIPYTPEELIAIAERELAWCNEQRAIAAKEMGLGQDWKAAQAEVKKAHQKPGGQPAMIKMLADEAVTFLEKRDLLTIPELAKECWRMDMMSPARQKFTPYFTGGEVISISYPTDGMEHQDKRMTMRGNNLHYSRATVHHELIPGHHLQGYMAQRWNPHRRAFSTPFLIEGWALYWELRLWDMGFAHNAKDRIGMLFWRSHRCARIIFSLNFHLGKWSPEQCVEFLLDQVGHERRNATAEVRRSIQGGYGPLYQAAYMLGGIQLRALHRELVEQGAWTEKAFHDAVLKQNSIPIEYLRAALTEEPLSKEFPVRWKFDQN
jgi:uncharacterized protein (DUF885 family)